MSGEKNLAVVLHGINDVKFEDITFPEPGEHEVRIRMKKVGICGSDVHYVTHGRIGDFILQKPMVLGHESAGVVDKCGSKVVHLKPGDRVAIEPGVPCRMCEFCKTGRYNLCADIVFCATPPFDGNLCYYYKTAADFCFKLPEHVSLEEGALLEPLSVGVHGCRRAGISIGHRVLICGAGPIGLVNLLVAKAMGATSVCITDVMENRLSLAKQLGADTTLCVAGMSAEEMAKKARDVIGDFPDVTIDCVGIESTICTGIHATKSGGVLVLIGMGPPEVKIPIILAAVREVDIRGIFRYVNEYPIALDLVASGKVDVKPLITHRYSFKESLHAFETARTGEGGAIKVMISCD